MEARQSSPLCAHIGRLLLLTVLICSHLPEAQGKVTDFWCNDQDRASMQNRTENLKKKMEECVGSDVLPSPMKLPCPHVRAAEWKSKTVHQKSAEVMGALRLFLDGVQKARTQTTLQNSSSACGASVLRTLEHHITNYIAIVNRVYEQNGAFQSAEDDCRSVESISKVLEKFIQLLRTKLRLLANSLRDSMCNSDHKT